MYRSFAVFLDKVGSIFELISCRELLWDRLWCSNGGSRDMEAENRVLLAEGATLLEMGPVWGGACTELG